MLVNAAECEPLLYTDFTILREHLDRVCEGARELCDAMGAAEVLVAMKEHTALRLGVARGEELPCGARAALLPDAYPTVSYTHLDVYKRQDHLQLLRAGRIPAGGRSCVGGGLRAL